MRRTDEHKIDRQFREGLSGAEDNIPFREEDWDELEGLLSKDRKRRVVWIYWASAGIAAALLVLMFRGFFVPTEVRDRKTVKTGGVPEKVTAPLLKDTVGPEMRKDEDQVRRYAGNKGKRRGISGVPLTARGQVTGNQQMAGSEDSTAAGKQIFTDTAAYAAIKEGVMTKPDSAEERSPETPVYNLADPVTAKRKKIALSLALVTAPDLNGVNSLSQSDVGLNGGLLLNVSFLKRWSVTTGLVYASKPYQVSYAQAAAGAYGSYGYGSRQLQRVDANCRVLDIPLNINYRLLGGKKNAISIGMGMSSYIMLQERYSFSYTDNSDWSYQIRNRNQHIMGVLNLNAGYQHQLGNRFDLLVQPYYKLPLTKIGNEGIDLRSAGVALGVGWDIGKRIKK